MGKFVSMFVSIELVISGQLLAFFSIGIHSMCKAE